MKTEICYALNMKIIRACAVIVHEDKILVFRRKINSDEYYVFPGGKQETGETLEEAVVREAMEETSLAVKAEKLLWKLIVGEIENNFFLCSYISGEPKLGNANEAEQATESNQYEPMWKCFAEFPSLAFKPTEVRNWFIEDSKNNFENHLREHTRI
ncbi:MAG: hydrolase [Parcubacteria group bacterium]|nr:hydrolase [Parcubacteria group bacterium]